MTDLEIIKELEKYDTPSITNVVATYPANELCLGLYNPWTVDWYTDERIKCMYPELGPRCGYAVTCIYGLPDPGFNRLTFMDVADALDASPKPTVLALEQNFPPEIAGKIGLAGGNMTTTMKTLGCVGCVSNGPSRDIDEIRPMEFQYLLSGITPGHGDQAVHAVNVPVSISGMDVAPGEIIHMDENGAVKFPANRLADVLENVQKLAEHEGALQERLKKATNAAEIRAAFSGEAYGDDEKK
ncbi:MAG: RraA family protein [Candidatus Latescibacteria bacterium]|jgi:4-hydroxy-4-methyl-2-oxoglutarate aldolase|nr:RraA family protein [Candidatus Latescibacterota bacterium]MBT4138502.1 RraA family protein [Candidatus Latescibacterota bacterium]